MKFFEGIIKHRKLVVTFFAVAAILCAFLQMGVEVNYNLVDYLPEGVESTSALEIMDKEFTQSVPNARVMIKNTDFAGAIEYKNKLSAMDGVSDVMWLDDVMNIYQPISFIDEELLSGYYKDGNAIISLTIADAREVEIIGKIREVIGDNPISGQAVVTAVSQQMSSKEAMNAAMFLIPIIILILLLSTSSYFEPFLFLAAIGIAVLINMGTSIIFGKISFVTNSISPILQMAVSLDYAIFLLHSFENFRKETADVNEAMKKAMARSLPAVLASALTTLFGFLALTFMRFGIGSDLGINLAKGVIMSLVSVMIFLPALTLVCYKFIDKTKHKSIMPSFKALGHIIGKVKIPVLIVVILLIVPSFLGQQKNTFIYGIGSLEITSREGKDEADINGVFGKSTPLVVLVPKGETDKEVALSRELGEIENVSSVISYVNMVGAQIPTQFLGEDIKSQFYSENYCRIILYATTDQEGDEAFAVVGSAREVSRKYYGDKAMTVGHSANLYDIKDVITKDNLLVNIIAVISIGLVLLFTFKSISLPLILLITIETSIWINLSVSYFTSTALCYVGFLVISTVQLGATVDYAILFTDNYTICRKTLEKKDALFLSISETAGSIIVSSSILALAGIIIGITSSNDVVSQLGSLLGRGTILSAAMVLLFLPAATYIFDGLIGKTTLKSNFFKKELSK